MGKQLLEACGGNLELAINMHMEGGGATTSAAAYVTSHCVSFLLTLAVTNHRVSILLNF